MIWLTWRQHRALAAGALALLAAAAALLVPGGVHLRSTYATLGLGSCAHGGGGSCSDLANAFEQATSASLSEHIAPWLNFLPGLLGVFIGAPLIARELEIGTYRLVWTQDVTRRRWLLTKLSALAGLTVLAAGAFTLLLTWYRWPIDQVNGRFFPNSFDFEGLVPTAYALFAFATGALAGTMIRRTVPAMAATLITYVAIRESVEAWLRPHYRQALTVAFDPARAVAGPSTRSGDWTLGSGIADHTGTHLSTAATHQIYRAAGGGLPDYLHAHGLLRWVSYQPADRFWTFQLIEAGIFLALAVTLLIVSAQWVRRRTR